MYKWGCRFMYKSSDVADKLRDVAKLRGVTMKDALKKANLNFNMMTMMRTSMPKADTLAKLADELDCSVDYLMGRSPQLHTPGVEQAIVESSRNATEMLSLYVQLSERDQVLLIGRLQNMVEQAQSEKEGRGEVSGSSPAKAV